MKISLVYEVDSWGPNSHLLLFQGNFCLLCILNLDHRYPLVYLIVSIR